MEVPPEVLGWILGCLEKKDLKEVRLVCKKLERLAVPLLFNEIYLSTNLAEIEIAQTIVRKFGKSIKTVFFSAVEYTEIKWGRFKNASIRSRSVDNVRLAYTNYCRLRQDQQVLLRAGTFFGHLCYALRTIPNNQRLVVTDFEASLDRSGWERRRSRLWRVGDCPAQCSIQGCARGNLDHLRAMVCPQSLLRTAPQEGELVTQGDTPWSLVMMGLAATGSQVMELEMDSGHTRCVPRGAFDNTLQQPFPLHDIFQHLRKLRLGFLIVNNLVEKHIAQTLSAATKLKSLYIRAYWDTRRRRGGGPTAFEEIFGECQFPQLSSLILRGFTSTEAELVRFLRSSSYLQQLTLTNHILAWKDEWESCANGIKLVLPNLQYITVNVLTSNYRGQDVHLCSCIDVQGFFFQGKVNPFICLYSQDESVCVTFKSELGEDTSLPGAAACVRARASRS